MDVAHAVPEVRPGRRGLAWLVAELVVLALAVHLVLPEVSGLEAVGRAVSTAKWWAGASALVLEAASLGAYGRLLHATLLAMAEATPQRLTLRVVLAGTALSKTLPGGTSAALPFQVRALSASGCDAATSAAALAGSGLASSLVMLVVLVPVAAALALAGGHGAGLGASLPLVALVVLGYGCVLLALRNDRLVADLVRRVAGWGARGPLRHRLDPQRLATAVEVAADGLRRLRSSPRAWRAIAGWATANWLLDAAALAVMAVAVGPGVPAAGLLLAYAVGQLVAAVPLTPGAVGFVETAMIGALVAQGAPAAAATATVLAWRLASHWIPIAVGLGVFFTLPSGTPSRADL